MPTLLNFLYYMCLAEECDRFSETTFDVIFPNGTTTVTFLINITDDDIYEGDESFTLQIQDSLPNLVTLGEPSIATVVIQEDENSKYVTCICEFISLFAYSLVII